MKTLLQIGFVLLLLTGCKGTEHNPEAAAKTAERFAEIAFVQQDAAGAYEMLAKELKQSETVESTAAFIADMHKGSYPSSVKATRYAPIVGQDALSLFMHGANGEENYYYQFIMQGDAKSGYKVGRIYRRKDAPPESEGQPIK